MKIKPEHLEKLTWFIAEQHTTEQLTTFRNQYLNRDASIPRIEQTKNPELRFLWDVFWSIPSAKRGPLVDELYTYMNDEHLTTALKVAIKAVA